MIAVFTPDATTFTTTGQGVLDADAVSAEVEETLNSDFTLTLTYPTTAPHAGLLIVGAIVGCAVPGRQEVQGFRIHTVSTNLEGLVEVVALHVSYDLASSVIVDTFVVNKTANQALAQLLEAGQVADRFTAISDVNVVDSARVVRTPVLEAIFGSNHNSLLSRWGGEILRDNHHLSHHTRLGMDRGVAIRDRKNLTGYSSTIDYTPIATRVLPVGFDGLTLPEVFIDSPRITNYPSSLVKVMRFEHIKAAKNPANPTEDELPLDKAYEALRSECHAAFEAGLDLPASSYEVGFVELATTREYADFAALEQVHLGDTVHVIHDDLAVRLTTRVVGYTWDALRATYLTIRLGSATQSLTSQTRTLASAVQHTAETLSAIALDAASALVSANGKNTIHYTTTQPTKARVGDTWFKPNGQAVEIWIYTKGAHGDEWVSIASDINHHALEQELNEARHLVETAVGKAGEAQGLAQQVRAQATTNHTLITEAKAAAEQARQDANEIATSMVALREHDRHVDEELTKANSIIATVKRAAESATQAATALREDVTVQGRELKDAKAQAEATKNAHDALRLEFSAYQDTTNTALVSVRDSVLLRVQKDELIAQINVSPEGVLIDGSRIHITGRTVIDDASIHGAKIIDATIASAKIASLDAGKITTGTLSADRLEAGSITSDKLSISDGFISRAMIRDAAINSAKIAGLRAEKITSGFLAAARIQAGSITSDKLTIADGFITNAMIADATISSAKIGSINASTITSGTLAAERIATGSITSDKLAIANGFITNAMIANAAVTSAKIASLDAGKITSGYLSASRIKAGSITADKLAANAIQVGLAGWTSSIRISPTTLSWYSGGTLEGQITSSGMEFYYGSRFIGVMGQGQKEGQPDVRGIALQLNGQGDYVTWSFRQGNTGTYTTMFTLDPKGKFNTGQPGIHLGAGLYTHANNFYTEGKRQISLLDCTLTGLGTYPGWSNANGKAKLVFQTDDLVIVTRNYFYNVTYLVARVKELMSRMNTLITRLNQGWVTSITDKGGGNITWNYYNNTGLQTMSTQLG